MGIRGGEVLRIQKLPTSQGFANLIARSGRQPPGDVGPTLGEGGRHLHTVPAGPVNRERDSQDIVQLLQDHIGGTAAIPDIEAASTYWAQLSRLPRLTGVK